MTFLNLIVSNTIALWGNWIDIQKMKENYNYSNFGKNPPTNYSMVFWDFLEKDIEETLTWGL